MDKQWYKNARDTMKDLKNIDPDKATRDQFVLFASCVSLQDHFDHQGETTPHQEPEIATESHAEPPQDEQSPIDMMMDESDDLYSEYKKNKSLELIHHSKEHGAIAEDVLRKMLDKDETIMIALYCSADAKERQLIRESYQRTLENMA